ncbi:glycosyl hydrolase family 18 protein [Nocardioides plantarum]|uniref:Glycosyl hydrolase family 18 protein n=1 Tax=Nocardioides plantarum TaxID=29299 RepID=A0ABV5K790_9ACTN|nr:glycosyl hydrolase family 18 protein [Nocardioides plantarum]
MLRTPIALALVTTTLVTALVAGGPVHDPALAAPAATTRAALPLTGFAYGGLPRATLRRDAPALRTVTVDGVALAADGRAVAEPDEAMVGLGRSARAKGLHTELLVHNFSGRLDDFDPRRAHRLLADPQAIARVSAQLAGLVDAGGWDGVNVDLELVPEDDAPGLVALCEALQDALPADRTVTIDISAAASPRAYRRHGYDLTGIAAAVDRIELMAYDEHGPGWSEPGAIGGLRWQREAAVAMRRVVPADKIDLGTAAYGYAWRDGHQGRGSTLSPALARATARRAGVRPVWHAGVAEWSARLPSGTVVWWADARSLRHRAALARDLGLHGLALWRLGPADPLV